MMELRLVLGLVFAVATAVATNLAFLWKHRGAVAAPAVSLRAPVRSAAELFRSKWWAIGWAVAVVGWVFHVGALALAPLSLAQAVIAGGFVVLAVLAERLFGFELHRRQWGGIALVAAGLAILGVTTPTTVEQTRYSIVAIAAFQTVLLIVGLVLVAVTHATAVRHEGPLDDGSAGGERSGDEYPRTGGAPQAPVTAHTTRGGSRWAGILLGTAAGIAFGVSDVSIKALAEDVIGDALAIVSPWTVTALIASLGAFYASARSLQIGEGIAVITATTSAANLSTIAGGIIVFGERLGDDALETALRVSAFVLVVAGAALMPGPMRAAEAGAEEERHEQAAPERGAAAREPAMVK
jgi:multidrug transporter EmrE-like cation transporter